MNLLSPLQQRSDRNERDSALEVVSGETESDSESDVAETPLFRLGRILFGGILAFNAIDNLRNLDERIAYAESKNTPMAEFTVPAISGGLLMGGLGIVLWRVPTAAAAAVVSFLVSVTPVMHDFWNVDDPERKQQELIHFLKNTALLGAALALLKVGQRENRESEN